jgi:glycosyltransferase involved in cell wall biosynthesis
MRILFLSDAGSYHTQRWVNYFVDRGHRCFLISLERGFPTQAQEFLVSPVPLPNFLRYPLWVPKIKRMVKNIQPDLVNAHFVPNYGLIGALLKIHPLVVSTWGSDVLISPEKSWFHRLRAKRILSKADLITTDAMVSAEAIYKLGVGKERVLITPMGVEGRLMGQHQKRAKSSLLVMSNRKLEPLYDVATLIKAIPLIVKRAKRDVKFVIIGEGSQKNYLLNLAIKYKAESYVEFKGVLFREALIQCYQDSDIYVSTSLSDSTSVSLLEAMAFGLIPVVTDIPGNREWIQEGGNGFLFPKSDQGVLAERMVHVINEFNKWDEFRDKNASLIKTRAVWEDNLKAVEVEFTRLAGRDCDRVVEDPPQDG